MPQVSYGYRRMRQQSDNTTCHGAESKTQAPDVTKAECMPNCCHASKHTEAQYILKTKAPFSLREPFPLHSQKRQSQIPGPGGRAHWQQQTSQCCCWRSALPATQ